MFFCRCRIIIIQMPTWRRASDSGYRMVVPRCLEMLVTCILSFCLAFGLLLASHLDGHERGLTVSPYLCRKCALVRTKKAQSGRDRAK